MSPKRLLLHIGTEKTGSTAIQHALASNREKLGAAGFLVPRVLGPENHTHLVAASLDDDVYDNIKAHLLARQGVDPPGFRRMLGHGLEQELCRTQPWHTIIATSELIHSRLIRPSEITRLLKFFSPYVDDVQIVMFLRRQDELAISRFSSILRAGYGSFDDVLADLGAKQYFRAPAEKLPKDFSDYYDYQRLVERFLVHVPSTSVVIELYQKLLTPGGSAVSTFLRHACIDTALVAQRDDVHNPGLSTKAQFVMAEVNKRALPYFPSGLRNIGLKSLHRRIEENILGDKRSLTRDDARSFYDHFRESNDWVRQTFFPERSTLFNEDFSTYPEAIDYGEAMNSVRHIVDRLVIECEQLPTREPLRDLFHRFVKRQFGGELR